MLRKLLKPDEPPRVDDDLEVIAAQRAFDEAEAIFRSIDGSPTTRGTYQRMLLIRNPGPGSLGLASLKCDEDEYEEMQVRFPDVSQKRLSAKRTRDQRDAALTAARAEAKNRRIAYWQQRVADDLDATIGVLDGPFRERLTRFLATLKEADGEGIKLLADDLPDWWRFDHPSQPGLDHQLNGVRTQVRNWRAEAEQVIGAVVK